MTFAAVLAALALTWLSGYWMDRSRKARLDSGERDALWASAMEYGRQVERRTIWHALWTARPVGDRTVTGRETQGVA